MTLLRKVVKLLIPLLKYPISDRLLIYCNRLLKGLLFLFVRFLFVSLFFSAVLINVKMNIFKSDLLFRDQTKN